MKIRKWLMMALMSLLVLAVLPLTAAASDSSVRLSPSSITLEVGESYRIRVIGSSKKAKWKSSKKKVATVNSKGLVTAKKAGSTTITAKVGKKTLKCKVKVVKVTGLWVVEAGSFTSQYNTARQFIRVKDLVSDAYWEKAGDTYTIYAGSFYDRGRAIARRNYLNYYGVDASIEYN